MGGVGRHKRPSRSGSLPPCYVHSAFVPRLEPEHVRHISLISHIHRPFQAFRQLTVNQCALVAAKAREEVVEGSQIRQVESEPVVSRSEFERTSSRESLNGA